MSARPGGPANGLARAGDGGYEQVTHVEGEPLDAPIQVRVLLDGEQLLCLEVRAPAGHGTPRHVHDDHESAIHVIEGRIDATLDDGQLDLGPGDAWLVRAGVPHAMRAVTDAVWLEMKSPPTKTW